jgi:D-glycero-alpha-D-manno-heptose 1-phosphate guanylyltransferase
LPIGGRKNIWLMPITEAIILAGGLGTRLQAAVPDLPKCMAPVNNRPFLHYVIAHFQQQGIRQFIFSLGYRSEAFLQFLSEELPEKNYELVVEPYPLGTGGAIQFAAAKAKTANVLVANGDSIFKVSVSILEDLHKTHSADCTLALKPMSHFSRYGTVTLLSNAEIESFSEKKYCAQGLINGGVYLLHLPHFLEKPFQEKFSFETDYLEKYFPTDTMVGSIQDAYFIDIGIPEDYEKAQGEL